MATFSSSLRGAPAGLKTRLPDGRCGQRQWRGLRGRGDMAASAAAVAVAMTAAGLPGVDFGELGVGEQGEVVGDGDPFRPADLQTRGLQAAQRAAADVLLDDDGVGRRVSQGAQQRAALAGGRGGGRGC